MRRRALLAINVVSRVRQHCVVVFEAKQSSEHLARLGLKELLAIFISVCIGSRAHFLCMVVVVGWVRNNLWYSTVLWVRGLYICTVLYVPTLLVAL